MRLSTTFILFVCCINLFSQQPLYVVAKHLNTSNDFPANVIYHIEFDKNGKSFVASDKGIITYDGKNTQLLSKQNGLPDNEIFNLKVKDSLLYFLPLKGNVYALNLYKNKYQYDEKIKTSQVLKYMLINDSLFYVCSYGEILVKNKNTQVISTLNFRWDIDIYLFNETFYAKGKDYLLKFNLTKSKVDTIKVNVKKMDALYVDKNIHYSYKNFFFTKNTTNQNTDSFLIKGLDKNVSIKKITAINDSLFFVNTSNNTFDVLNTKQNTLINLISNVSVNNVVYNSAIKSFFICTNNGLYIVNKNCKTNLQSSQFNEGISYLSVDEQGNYNIGFENGAVFHNQALHKYNDYKVTSLLNYKNTLFCGLDVSFKLIDKQKCKAFYTFDKNSIKNAVIVDSVVYITTSKQLLKFNLINFKRDVIISANHRSYYLQHHRGKLYTQSYTTDSLLAIDLTTGKINYLAKFNGQVIKSIELNNVIYFLTDLGNLYIYDQTTTKCIHIFNYLNYTLTNFSFFEYYNNHLLIGNNDACVSASILELRKNHYVFNNLNLDFPANTKYIQLKNKNIYYTSNCSVNYFPLRNKSKEQNFYQLSIKQKKINFYRDGVFSESMGKCEINFESVTYDSKDEELTYYLITPNKYITKHRTKQLQLNLDSLPVGTNYLVCFVTDNKLNESNKIIIPIDIKDKSSQEILITLLLYGIGILLISYLIFRYKLIRLKQQHAIKTEYILTEQKASALLMNPHFVFNALGNIQGFIGAKQLEKANAYLLKFSLVVRSYLNFMQEGIVSLDQELESLINFIEFQKIKYEDTLEFKLIKESNFSLGNIRIPAFVIQPFVENSIKFFKNHKPTLVIEVSISNVINNSYTITIKDNGPGLSKELSKDDLLKKQVDETAEFRSLSFTLQRLKKIHEVNGLNFDFEIENCYNDDNIDGVRVILKLNNLKMEG